VFVPGEDSHPYLYPTSGYAIANPTYTGFLHTLSAWPRDRHHHFPS